MKIYNKNFIVLIITALFFPALVFATPGIPHQFYGTVAFSEGESVDGLTVKAKIDDVVIGSSVIGAGKYGYNPDLLFVTDNNSSNSGKIISFYVSGIKANETAEFITGESTKLNLTVSGTIGTIEVADENTVIENEIMIIAPDQSGSISFGENLNITISSDVDTHADITTIEKLEDDFFTGDTAIISGNNLLNAFEINITGDDLIIIISMTYDDADIDENTIKPYRFDGTSWVEITPFSINKTINTITFEISSAETPYVVFGEELVPVVSYSGGGGGTPSSTPTPSPTLLSEAAQAVDINGDGKIDIFDFNGLIVNWGSTEIDNIADFDNNGTIDIFDFNLLMTYWTG